MILSDLKTVKPSLGTVYLSGRGFMACTAASQQWAMKMCRLYFRELTTFTYSQTDVINQQNYLFFAFWCLLVLWCCSSTYIIEHFPIINTCMTELPFTDSTQSDTLTSSICQHSYSASSAPPRLLSCSLAISFLHWHPSKAPSTTLILEIRSVHIRSQQ